MANPHTYTPGNIPNWSPEESIETYMERFLPWLQSEFASLQLHLQQKAIIERSYEAPRAPFDGMIRLFPTAGWRPSNAAGGYFIYDESSNGWWRLTITGPFTHQ